MEQTDCVFCNIANHTMTSEIIDENSDFMVIKDIFPKAPVHLLIIPKKHIPSVTDLGAEDANLIGQMVMAGKQAAEKQGVAETGYKLIFTVGKHGGQIVPHLKLHLLGGKQLAE